MDHSILSGKISSVMGQEDNKRVRIPPDTEVQVFAKSGRRCCLCWGLHRTHQVVQGQIVHLDHDRTNSELKNLAFLCMQHHDQYDSKTSQSKGFSELEVKNYRDKLYAALPQILSIAGNQVASQPAHIRTVPTAADIMQEMYSQLANATTALQMLLQPAKAGSRSKQRQGVVDMFNEYFRYFDSHQYLFPASMGEHMERLAEVVRRCREAIVNDNPARARQAILEIEAVRKGIDAVLRDEMTIAPSTQSVSGQGHIVAGRDLQVVIKLNGKKCLPPPVVAGTVTGDHKKFNYLEYLVRRYKEFKEAECKKNGTCMNHALIRVAYEREIGCKVQFTPLSRFDNAVMFLQRRINQTIVGKVQRAKGLPLYTEFEDFQT